jgi:hypothetical protein
MKRRYVVVGLAAIAVLAIASPGFGVSLKNLVKKEVAKQISKATGPAGPQGPDGLQGPKGDPGQAGTPGTARAYALVGGGSCTGTPTPFCQLLKNKGVAYVAKIGTGHYCVGVSGIEASAADSVAMVQPVNGAGAVDSLAWWHSSNVGCVSSEFEVKTEGIDPGSPPQPSDEPFTIAIL